MALIGDDCYFYYYSKCSGGDLCRFRHSPAALGCEVMCTLWLQGNCTRPGCKFRHMEIRKNRNTIACYWESQPGGCTKAHCVFMHNNKPSSSISATQLSSSVPAAEAQDPATGEEEATPSPPYIPTQQVDPIVFNPFEEESDQESVSTSGSPIKPVLSEVKVIPGKTVKTRLGNSPEENLDFGIRSLSDIKRKMVAVQPVTSSGVRHSPLHSRLGRQIISKTREEPVSQEPAPFGRRIIIAKDDTREVKSPPKVSIKRRLGLFTGNKNDDTDTDEDGPPKAKVSIKNRLGLGAPKTDDLDTDEDRPLRSEVSIKNRLGLGAPKSDDTDSEEEDRPLKSEVIIKKRLGLGAPKTGESSLEEKSEVSPLSLEDIRRNRTLRSIRDHISPPSVKTVRMVKEESTSESAPVPAIKIKTLEEIKREKALKAMKSAKATSLSTEETGPKVKSLEEIRREKMAKRSSQSAEKSSSATDHVNIKIKSLVEIKREKRKPLAADFSSEDDASTTDLGQIKVKSLAEIKKAKGKPVVEKVSDDESSNSSVVSAVSSSTQENSKPKLVRRTVEEIQTKQKKYRKIGHAWRTAAEEAEKRITSLDSSSGPSTEREKPQKRPVRPERQIYRPPLRSKTDELPSKPTSEVKITSQVKTTSEVKTETKLISAPKRSQGWGVKTFSEIMKEKQLKRLRPQEIVESEADSSEAKEPSSGVDEETSSRLQASDEEFVVDSSESSFPTSSSDYIEPTLSLEADSSSAPKKSRLSSEGSLPDQATPSGVTARRRSSIKKSDTPSDVERKLSDSFLNDEDLDALIGDVTMGTTTDHKDTEDLLMEMDELLS